MSVSATFEIVRPRARTLGGPRDLGGERARSTQRRGLSHMMSPVRIVALAIALCALLAAPAAASRIDRQERADAHASAFQRATTKIPVRDPAPPPGAQVLKYKFGPLKIR